MALSYNDDISLEDAIHTALLTLKEGFEGQMTEKMIEIGVVTVPSQAELEEGKVEGTGRYKPTFRKLTEEEIKAIDKIPEGGNTHKVCRDAWLPVTVFYEQDKETSW